jgi:hypothetical protein
VARRGFSAIGAPRHSYSVCSYYGRVLWPICVVGMQRPRVKSCGYIIRCNVDLNKASILKKKSSNRARFMQVLILLVRGF